LRGGALFGTVARCLSTLGEWITASRARGLLTSLSVACGAGRSRSVESRTSARRSNHPAFWSRLADRESRYNQARSPTPEEAEEFTDGYIYTEETMTLDELPNPNAP